MQLAADKAEAASEAELVRRAMAKEKAMPPVKGFFGAAAKCVFSCDCPFAVSLGTGLGSASALLLLVPLFFCISSYKHRMQSNGLALSDMATIATSGIHCAWLCTNIVQCGRLSFDTLPTWLSVGRGGLRGSGSGADAASDDPDLPDGNPMLSCHALCTDGICCYW